MAPTRFCARSTVVSDARIWATRPAYQNAQWHESLVELGHPVVDLPLMMIEPVQDATEIQAVKNLILDFDQFHKVIFVSQNAVRETFAWLRDYWPQLPGGVEYFAVGRKTAEAVMAELRRRDLVSIGLAGRVHGLLGVAGLQAIATWPVTSFKMFADTTGQSYTYVTTGRTHTERTGSTTSKHPPFRFLNGNEYQWRVRAVNASGTGQRSAKDSIAAGSRGRTFRRRRRGRCTRWYARNGWKDDDERPVTAPDRGDARLRDGERLDRGVDVQPFDHAALRDRLAERLHELPEEHPFHLRRGAPEPLLVATGGGGRALRRADRAGLSARQRRHLGRVCR